MQALARLVKRSKLWRLRQNYRFVSWWTRHAYWIGVSLVQRSELARANHGLPAVLMFRSNQASDRYFRRPQDRR